MNAKLMKPTQLIWEYVLKQKQLVKKINIIIPRLINAWLRHTLHLHILQTFCFKIMTLNNMKLTTKTYKTSLKISRIVFKTAQQQSPTSVRSYKHVQSAQQIQIYLTYKQVNARCVAQAGSTAHNNTNAQLNDDFYQGYICYD